MLQLRLLRISPLVLASSCWLVAGCSSDSAPNPADPTGAASTQDPSTEPGSDAGGTVPTSGTSTEPTPSSENSSGTPSTTMDPGPAPHDPTIDPEQTSFESDLPSQSGSRDAVGGATDSPAPSAGDGASDDPQRAIEEADIIKIDGDRLYALSRYGGLNVIDVSNPDALRLLGRSRQDATPFEMYVRDDVTVVLYNDYGDYTQDDDGNWVYYQTSYVVALDTTDPSNITELGHFDVPGAISDSRLVGDVLYVAAYENGYCWGCASTQQTNVVSLDLSDPMAIHKVDSLSFEERSDTYSWKRSLSATNERLYVAGPHWGSDGPLGSTIQVIDITDPSGDLVAGASVDVEGQIESRWQMDEFDGVLRVVSQPGLWNTSEVPVVQTFSIESSDSFTALGREELRLPRPERLESVRFDGERGYAITVEQTDPLFTIDLSDPAAPRQVGELEMPGWVYYLEPRGDRVLGLGFDNASDVGALTVSLFDVSNMASPQMIDRVNFGGDWAWLGEDQDRIHKAFRVLDEDNLILVPFSGTEVTYTDDTQTCASYDYVSGVQLVDWQSDELTLRGVANAVGQARRGFLLQDRLFTVTDDRVQTFDIQDRDAPEQKDSLPLALRVDQTAVTGDKVVRVTQDWYSNTVQLDVTTLAQADALQGQGQLELPQFDAKGCYGSSYLNQVVAGEDAVYLVYTSYEYEPSTGKSTQWTRVLTVDVSDPAAPVAAGDVTLDFTPSYYYPYGGNAYNSGESLVSVGSTLVFEQLTSTYDSVKQSYDTSASLKVVDLSDPNAAVVSTLELAEGSVATALVRDGNIVAWGRYSEADADTGRVRFYLERLDVSDGKHPQLLPSVNVPGAVVALDAGAGRALTLDYKNRVVDGAHSTDCYENGGMFAYPPDATNITSETLGSCTFTTQTLNVMALNDDNTAHIVERYNLPESQRVTAVAVGSDRVFVAYGAGYYYYGVTDAPVAGDAIGGGGRYYSFTTGEAKLLAISGLESGELALANLTLETGNMYGGGLNLLRASGVHAIASTGWQGELVVLDATDPGKLELVYEAEVPGYVSDLDVSRDVAVASLGYAGVAVVPLD